MRDRIDKAAIDQRQPRRAEPGRNRNAVGAIAIHQAGRCAVERCVLAVKHRHRDEFAIRCLCLQASCDIGGRIVAGRNFLALAQHACALDEVVVPDFVRCRHRRIGEAQRVGLEFVTRIGTERISLLSKRDGVFLAGLKLVHNDAWQAVGALEPDQPVGIDGECQHVDAWTIRHEILPVFVRRRRHGRPDDFEILRFVRIGADDERRCAAEIGMMLDLVVDVRPPRRHQRRRGFRVGQIEQPAFRGFVIVNGNLRIAAGLQVYERTQSNSGLYFRTQARRRSPACRGDGEKLSADDATRPSARSRRLWNPWSTPQPRRYRGQYRSGRAAFDVAYAYRVEFRARPRRPAMRSACDQANAVHRRNERTVCPRQNVAVEQHLVRSAAARLATELRMLRRPRCSEMK